MSEKIGDLRVGKSSFYSCGIIEPEFTDRVPFNRLWADDSRENYLMHPGHFSHNSGMGAGIMLPELLCCYPILPAYQGDSLNHSIRSLSSQERLRYLAVTAVSAITARAMSRNWMVSHVFSVRLQSCQSCHTYSIAK